MIHLLFSTATRRQGQEDWLHVVVPPTGRPSPAAQRLFAVPMRSWRSSALRCLRFMYTCYLFLLSKSSVGLPQWSLPCGVNNPLIHERPHVRGVPVDAYDAASRLPGTSCWCYLVQINTCLWTWINDNVSRITDVWVVETPSCESSIWSICLYSNFGTYHFLLFLYNL
jgi:hypothetical protein